MQVRSAILFIALMILLPQQLPAQGVFDVLGFPKTVTATGHTEVLGTVQVALRQGAVSADTLVIDVSPLQITNTIAADIRVTTGGNITIGAVTIDTDTSRVRVPVNAGGTSGFLRIDGIRVSVAGTNISSVTARVSWAGVQNVLTTQSVLVVNQVKSGLYVDPMTDGFLVFNNVVVRNTATIVVREGYNSAFLNSADFGQNTPARIRIRVTDFPTGLVMHFPASVTANESAAILTTVEGAAVDLPRANGSTEVTYNFNGSADSANVLESFNIAFTVSTQGTVAIVQPTIELSLAPIGAAVPSTALPATNVPRYAEENIVVLEGSSRIITKTFYWTGIANSRENRLSVFNPASAGANLTFSAFDAVGQLISGTNVNNSVRQSFSANQSSDQSLRDIFGAGATNIATVRVQSTGRDVVALGTTLAAGLAESVQLIDRAVQNFVVPYVDEQGRLDIFNPGTARTSGALTLKTLDGVVVATKSLDVDPMGSTSRSLRDLFGTDADGQVIGSFAGAVIAFESFGASSDLNFVAAQAPVGIPSLYIPFFATGGGYETDLSLVNASNQTFTLTAQLVNSQGTPVTSSRLITMRPSEQLITTISRVFQMQSFATGYVRIQVPQAAFGFFTFYPAISGYARIRSGQSASTVVPISAYPLLDSSILASGTSAGQFQGIAVLNPNDSAVTVTLQALSSTGTVLGTAAVNLMAGQISSKLTSEYFSVAIPERSVIRVTGSAPIVATSVSGSLTGDTLRASPALR